MLLTDRVSKSHSPYHLKILRNNKKAPSYHQKEILFLATSWFLPVDFCFYLYPIKITICNDLFTCNTLNPNIQWAQQFSSTSHNLDYCAVVLRKNILTHFLWGRHFTKTSIFCMYNVLKRGRWPFLQFWVYFLSGKLGAPNNNKLDLNTLQKIFP